jgi:hypothetical protein
MTDEILEFINRTVSTPALIYGLIVTCVGLYFNNKQKGE